MKILSNFHDYYDSVMSYGRDNTLIYHRNINELYTNDIHFHNKYTYYTLGYSNNINSRPEVLFVYFCGKFYPIVSFYNRNFNNYYTYLYSSTEVDKYVENNFSKKFVDSYFSNYKKSVLKQTDVLEHFNLFTGDNCNKVFGKFVNDNPIFTVRKSNSGLFRHLVTYNDILKNIEFYKVLDTYSAFQEIEMFLSNIAVPQKDMPVIPDVLKAESHGFDKYSFRKDKK